MTINIKLKTIEELKEEIDIIPKSELTKKYDDKKTNRNDSIESKLSIVEEVKNPFGERISSPKIVGADFTENYGLVFFNLTHDPRHNKGKNGCAYSSQLQLVDLNNDWDKMLIKTFNYRKTGNSAFDHKMNFSEGKILEETNDKILFGIKSHEILDFIEWDINSKEQKVIEKVNLEYISKNKEQLEKFDEAFNELNVNSLKDFFQESNYFTKALRLSDNYALIFQQDPYGDTGYRHAKIKVVVKDKGVIDLEEHKKKFDGSQVTQSLEIKDAKISFTAKGLMLNYVIKETESIPHAMGIKLSTLGETSYSVKLDIDNLPVGVDLKLDALVESEKNGWLSHGNLNPIHILDDGLATYPYNIDSIIEGEKAYVSVVNVIDCERYAQGILFDPQIKVSVYEVNNSSENPSIKEVFSHTSLRGDQKGGLTLNASKDGSVLSFYSKPKLESTDDGIKVSYKLQGEKTVVKEYLVDLNKKTTRNLF